MNEKRVEVVLEIEQQAQAIVDAARREAEAVPQQAEQEAQAVLAKARAAAEDQARALLAHAEPVEQSGHILSQAEESIRKSEVMALTYFDRAVAYVLTRVAGRG